jgi:hypothetical protein
MYNLYPPFAQLWVALLHPLDVLFGVARINQGQHNVFHNKPPFIVVDRAADFLSLEKGDAGFGVWAGVIHARISENHSPTRSRMASSEFEICPVGSARLAHS